MYQFEAGQAAATQERRDDIDEILNYRRAMRRAEEMLTELPLSLRVVRETHQCVCFPECVAGTKHLANTVEPPIGSVRPDARSKKRSSSRLVQNNLVVR